MGPVTWVAGARPELNGQKYMGFTVFFLFQFYKNPQRYGNGMRKNMWWNFENNGWDKNIHIIPRRPVLGKFQRPNRRGHPKMVVIVMESPPKRLRKILVYLDVAGSL